MGNRSVSRALRSSFGPRGAAPWGRAYVGAARAQLTKLCKQLGLGEARPPAEELGERPSTSLRLRAIERGGAAMRVPLDNRHDDIALARLHERVQSA